MFEFDTGRLDLSMGDRDVDSKLNHFISNKGEWNNCFSKFSNRVLPPIFISAIIEG